MRILLLPTHNIANKGFSGMRKLVARFNFLCNLIGKKPAIPYWPYCQPLVKMPPAFSLTVRVPIVPGMAEGTFPNIVFHTMP